MILYLPSHQIFHRKVNRLMTLLTVEWKTSQSASATSQVVVVSRQSCLKEGSAMTLIGILPVRRLKIELFHGPRGIVMVMWMRLAQRRGRRTAEV